MEPIAAGVRWSAQQLPEAAIMVVNDLRMFGQFSDPLAGQWQAKGVALLIHPLHHCVIVRLPYEASFVREADFQEVAFGVEPGSNLPALHATPPWVAMPGSTHRQGPGVGDFIAGYRAHLRGFDRYHGGSVAV